MTSIKSILLLIASVSITQIAYSQPSVDSTTITSELFDTLAYRNVRAQYCDKEIPNLRFQLKKKTEENQSDSTMLFAERTLYKIDMISCDVTQKNLKTALKANTRTKFVAGVIIVLEAVGIGYFASKH